MSVSNGVVQATAPLQDSQDEAAAGPVELRILIPAFMISELRRAFEIGFLLFVPFVVIDMVVASVLMSMGMMMLPPIVISLPFKLIFFVLVDGWNLKTPDGFANCERGRTHSSSSTPFKRCSNRAEHGPPKAWISSLRKCRSAAVVSFVSKLPAVSSSCLAIMVSGSRMAATAGTRPKSRRSSTSRAARRRRGRPGSPGSAARPTAGPSSAPCEASSCAGTRRPRRWRAPAPRPAPPR